MKSLISARSVSKAGNGDAESRIDYLADILGLERKDVVGIKLDRNLMTMNVGNTTKLKATILPEDATNQSVTWTSSNTNVCTVDKNGNVKAVGTGTCRITCTSNDPYNSARASCWVTVR